MNEQSSKWLSLLGLAARARQIVTGEELVTKEVRAKSVRLVLLSQDASENTKKKILDKCSHYQVPVRIVADRETLGRAIGKTERVVIGIKDSGFATKMTAFIDQ
ncbi:YlxQ family RNA-binding protein [Alkalihalobacillus pseudalcaliphilus]|uniref:YlxQ family RNA-binding protein n=1 Tax=Alkalihalobacillus pseudalcaliphilus TaxID=79884 RepID=UPI00064DA268|nr:YlxQ family RNA-binding protein [Alkalihalobacillus pseudalcaliphilus]KMK77252.1 50S ribosomal protein L7 [Alkalihalobacillus pseudalcaliphilus]